MAALKKQDKGRPAASLGIFGTYDGNIIGGLLTGVGMTISGACPGTAIPQMVTRIPSGKYVLLGGLLGALLYVRFEKSLKAKEPALKSTDTVHRKWNLSHGSVLLAYETMMLSVVILVSILSPLRGPSFLHPVIGGIAIGATQFMSLSLTDHPVGVSTAYEEAARWTSSFLDQTQSETHTKGSAVSPPTRALSFVAGMFPGSWAFARSFVLPDGPLERISPLRAFSGGVVMLFGARIAGGCTSGHGISGMSQLGLSSVVTVASMFAGGICTAFALQYL